MIDLSRAFDGVLILLTAALGVAAMLTIYIIWQIFFGVDNWENCSKMETDTAKVQCMEAFQ